MKNLILASKSPRRKEILSNLGIPFKIIVSECDESIPSELSVFDVPEYLAKKKAEAVLESISDKNEKIILAADTLVHMSGKLYGKPKSRDEAFQFINEFQGTNHEVITGVALLDYSSGKNYSESVVTKIHFNKMNKDEIEFYLSKNEWKDAAGAYKIQGFASCFIDKIEGSYSNVVGLPISTVYAMLKKQGFEFS